MRIEKVELLWSRNCPLACAGCAMPNALRLDDDTTQHGGTLYEWDRAMQRAAAMGSRFVAVYGAEPLTRAGLAPVLRSIYANGMKATVITAYPDSAYMARLLHETPLDSVTMSYDIVYEDKDREVKGENTRRALEQLTAVPDVAVVVTVSAENVGQLTEVARTMSARGVWFLFDILHRSGGPHSKCGHEGPVAPPPEAAMRQAARDLLAMKAQGYKIHASRTYLELVAEKYDGEPRSLWHCGGKAVGWLTVDADGTVLACDDYQRRSPFKMWDAFQDDELERWLNFERRACLGCAWNTHVDAVGIVDGTIDGGSYVHLTS